MFYDCHYDDTYFLSFCLLKALLGASLQKLNFRFSNYKILIFVLTPIPYEVTFRFFTLHFVRQAWSSLVSLMLWSKYCFVFVFIFGFFLCVYEVPYWATQRLKWSSSFPLSLLFLFPSLLSFLSTSGHWLSSWTDSFKNTIRRDQIGCGGWSYGNRCGD